MTEGLDDFACAFVCVEFRFHVGHPYCLMAFVLAWLEKTRLKGHIRFHISKVHTNSGKQTLPCTCTAAVLWDNICIFVLFLFCFFETFRTTGAIFQPWNSSVLIDCGCLYLRGLFTVLFEFKS